MELLLYLYAESPVHAGAADSLGVLDLPIQREATTGYPVIWGQSLKGALRQAATQACDTQDSWWNEEQVTAVFGSPIRGFESDGSDDTRETTPGNLRVGDAQLVAMPVPTLRRTFAWVTSEIALSRMARKYRALGRDAATIPSLPQLNSSGGALSPSTHWTRSPNGEVLGPCVVAVEKEVSAALVTWADQLATDAIGTDAGLQHFADRLRSDLLLVDSEIMPVLLRECTEQAVRIQLDENKTVQNGPFHSEYLPAESILAASLSVREHGRDGAAEYDTEALSALVDGTLVQVGGDETLGKGLMWARLLVTNAGATG